LKTEQLCEGPDIDLGFTEGCAPSIDSLERR